MIDFLRENWTIKRLEHLPKIPDHLLIDFNSWNTFATTFDGAAITGDRTARRGLTTVKTATFTRYELPANVVQWIQQNIIAEYSDIGIAFTHNGNEHLPHTDLYREYALNYVLQTGGDNVITSFYSDDQAPLRKLNVVQPQDLDSLIEIDSMILPTGSWTLLNSRVIHGVKNLTGPRIMIGISFQQFPDQLFNIHNYIR